jgi:hypothetical protein
MDDPNYITESCELANQHITGFSSCVEAINATDSATLSSSVLNDLSEKIDNLYINLDNRMIEIDTNNQNNIQNDNGNDTVEVIDNHGKRDTKIIILLNIIICTLVLIILIKSFTSKC